ncbi:toxin co-regulated pilus biosynthesis Q family protein [Methylobacillus sp. Pita2]|uniref:toxin co-regulated pilus biosynthesis Q family protein n=1 Tax=Methylobacillus sp. Pita2 TaxID=3383245 RepID=UPI0038B62205
MNRWKMNLVVAAILGAIAPASAFAGFEVVDAPEEPAKEVAKPVAQKVAQLQPAAPKATIRQQAVLIGGLNQVGRKPAIIPPAKGMVNGQPLRDALSLLVPTSFSIYNDGNINLLSATSWRGNGQDDWTVVLGNLLRTSGIAATLDWDQSTLSLEKQVQKVAPPAPKPVWKLALADKTVRTALSRWSKSNNWQLDWDVAVDFPIPYDIEYQGEFKSAVEEVMQSLRGSDYPVEACAYDENRALRIVRMGEANKCKLASN